MHFLYLTNLTIHILAATIWIGGMLFLTLMLVPALRSLRDPPLMSRLLRDVGHRFNVIGWSCLAILLLTGSMNLYVRGVRISSLLDPLFWTSPFGGLVRDKLVLFGLIVLSSFLHDALVGARYRSLENDPTKYSALQRYRRAASWAGRLTLGFSILAVWIGVMLVRGRPW